MPLANARGIVRVAPDSVARILVNPNHTYHISPEVDKDNVQMGMIAVPQGFPGSTRTYYHQVFTRQTPAFNWQPRVDGHDFSVLYFYLLLPWTGGPPVPPMEPHKVSYSIGMNDGEAGDLPGNKVASLAIALKASRTQQMFGNTPPTSYSLPATPIEFSHNYHISVEPARGPSGNNLEWAEISVLRENGHPSLELKTRIHVISGRNGNDIEGIIQPTTNFGLSHSVQLGRMMTANNNINLFALVAPTVNPNDSNDFTFEVGDPEKDGKISIRTV